MVSIAAILMTLAVVIVVVISKVHLGHPHCEGAAQLFPFLHLPVRLGVPPLVPPLRAPRKGGVVLTQRHHAAAHALEALSVVSAHHGSDLSDSL